jgi:hypothetical protein
MGPGAEAGTTTVAERCRVTFPLLICIAPQERTDAMSCDKLTRRANQQKPVQPLAQKYFGFLVAQITGV